MKTSTLTARRAAPAAPRPVGVDTPSDLTARYRRRATVRARRVGVLTVAAWGSVAAAVALYLAYGGMAELATLPGTIRALGVVAGLVATDLTWLMLLLAARVPYVDRTLGHDRAVALHSRLGRWVRYGLTLHGLLLVTGYAVESGANPVAELLSLWSTTDLALAVALLVLAAVDVAAVVAVKRRLGHKAWHVIHLATYAAVGLSIPHQLSMSELFAEGTWQGWYWIGRYAVTALALLAFRVLLPLVSTLRHRLVVTRVVREADDVVSIEMTGRDLPVLGVAAGQFLGWRFLARGLWRHQHPFPVSAAPTTDTLRITVRDLGKGTTALMDVRPGTRVAIEGPYGGFTDEARTTDGLVLVGIGIGVAPVRALLEATDVVPGKATVILRAGRAEDLYLVREVDALCRAKGARLITLVGHRATLRDGTPLWVPESHKGLGLADIAPHLRDSDVYVCGPAAAAELVVADARAAGVPATAIHHERFSW